MLLGFRYTECIFVHNMGWLIRKGGPHEIHLYCERRLRIVNGTNIWLNPNIPFRRNWLLHLMIAAYVVFWVVMAIKPADWKDWALENVLVAVTLIVLAATYRKYRFTNLSYLLIALFLCLHTYGAHFAYRNTPFDTWLKQAYQTKRSYYDRLVHLGFGLLLLYPAKEILSRLNTMFLPPTPGAVRSCSPNQNG